MTPQEAQQLLNGVRNPGGDWDYNPGGGLSDRYIYDEDGPVISITDNGSGSDCDDNDLSLAAAAPELARTVAGLREEYLGYP